MQEVTERNFQIIAAELERVQKKLEEYENAIVQLNNAFQTVNAKVVLLEKEVIMVTLKGRGSGPTA